MRYPYINKRARQEILVPQLSGGLNLRDGVSGIADNQLTEAENLWFKNGMLRTRPPFNAKVAGVRSFEDKNLKGNVRVRLHPEINVNYNGEDCVLSSSKMLIDDLENESEYYVINFQFESNNKSFVLPSITGISHDVNYFLAEMKGVLYCYLSNCSVWKLEYEKADTSVSQALEWKKLSEEDMYVPTVMAHCNRSGMWDFSGTQLNGFNLLCGKYKMIYSAYNELDSDSTHPMKYGYLKELPKEKHIKITVKLTSQVTEGEQITAKTVEHTIDYYRPDDNDSWVRESLGYGEVPEDGLYLYTLKDRLEFFESDTSQTAYMLDTDEKKAKYGNIEDNIEIIAYYDTDKEEQKKVFCQTNAIWFGGSAKGINGGSRLFLCGNTEKNEKALVIWSGLNNPLYFGENCYTYIGDNSSAVTAFGRQEEKLIIFKENEIYYTYYAQNDGITAEDLINQTVVDYEANSVYFPIVTLNGNVGCDCPKTVQMCRNRLVWANSDGRIYTLCTVSQYNENTVYEISRMISDALKDKKELLKTATSADFDGHYILFLGNGAWVCDYNSYGYQYVYSYSKGEDANLKIPWYYWEFPFLSVDEESDIYTSADICVLSGELLMRAYYNASTKAKKACVTYRMNGSEVKGNDSVYENDFKSKRLKLFDKKIKCGFCTKLFDFGLLDYYKNIEAVKLMIGIEGSYATKVKIVTDVGEEEHNILSMGKDNDERAIAEVKPRIIRPSVKSVLRFGIKVEGEGQVLINGIRLIYRILGGVK